MILCDDEKEEEPHSEDSVYFLQKLELAMDRNVAILVPIRYLIEQTELKLSNVV